MIFQINFYALKKVQILLLIIVFNLFMSDSVHATHAAGADITYKCLGGLQYEITLAFYRDCAGIQEPNTAFITVASINYNYSVIFNAVKIPGTGQEITTPCNSVNTTCSGGSITGIRQFIYRTTVTLPAAQEDWKFSFSECCRNCAITTIQNPCGNNSLLYVEATLNNLAAPCNTSPEFSNIPIAFVCTGQNFNYNHGVLDADGDSLSYQLITPKTSASGMVTFIPPATAANPLSSSTTFLLDSITGDINFTPNQVQIGIMAVRVTEYRNGQVIGSVIRDMQVYTQSCSNSLPVVSGINNTTDYAITVCPNQQICFDIFSSDADAAQVLTLSHNNGIPGASYTLISGNQPGLHFCWTPGYSDVDLLPKTFTVTIKDNACPVNGIQTFSYSIFVPSPYFTASSENIKCHGANDGSATASPVFGDAYFYEWNTIPPQSGTTINNLSPGFYTVSVTDTNGCSADTTIFISEPDVLLLNAGVTHVSCHSTSTGMIDLTVSGGTLPYQFNWSNGESTEDISQLPAGTYSVMVTDANFCIDSLLAVVEEADSIQINALLSPVLCYNGNDGNIDLSVTGGNMPYSYLWSNNEITEDISGLSAGIYLVMITDQQQCSAAATFTIVEPDPISTLITGTDIECNSGNFGVADLTVTGGTPAYSFLWSNGETTEDIYGLSAGWYFVTVSDGNGCIASDSVEIKNITAPLSIVYSATQVSCFGYSDGSIDITVTGGTAPYFYTWSNGEISEDLFGLAAGTYHLFVEDTNKCFTTLEVDILQPDPLEISGMVTDASYQACDGAIDVSATGGTPPLSYSWSNSEVSEDINNLCPGIYTVTVTDQNGCTATSDFIVNEINTTGVFEIVPDDNELSIFPNPSFDMATISFTSPESGILTGFLTDQSGRIVKNLFEIFTIKNVRYERSINLQDVSAGNYFLVISPAYSGKNLVSRIMIAH